MDTMNAHAARECHEARRAYTVVAHGLHGCGGGKPSAAIHFHDTRVSLHVLDRRLRDYLTCEYEEAANGKLFLHAATYREFLAESDIVSITEEYNFQEAGAVHFEKRHFQDGILTSRTSKLNGFWNWEPYPIFGDYDSILEIRWVCQLDAV